MQAKNLLQKYRTPCIISVLVMAVIVTLVIMLPRGEAEPERYELETHGGEIDFHAPEIKAHTADNGIAVVRPSKKPDVSGNTAAYTEPETIADTPTTRTTDDHATIWQEETVPTHSGFTMPVQMDGDSIGVLTIPDIGLSARVYESETEMEAMEKGVAHFKHTSSWDGNIGFSAHNVNFDGTPGHFLNLYKLAKGAVITYETALGTREYMVESVTEISELDWSLLNRTQDNRLTLITCITGKQDMRLAVQALEKPHE